MKYKTFSFAIAAALAVIGCQNNESPNAAAQKNTPDSTSIAQEVGVDVPTQEQADAQAATEISAENADQAFQDLQTEIESGG